MLVFFNRDCNVVSGSLAAVGFLLESVIGSNPDSNLAEFSELWLNRRLNWPVLEHLEYFLCLGNGRCENLFNLTARESYWFW